MVGIWQLQQGSRFTLIIFLLAMPLGTMILRGGKVQVDQLDAMALVLLAALQGGSWLLL